MKRVNIYLADQQFQHLKKIAEETDIKFAEHNRRALDKYIEKRTQKHKRPNA